MRKAYLQAAALLLLTSVTFTSSHQLQAQTTTSQQLRVGDVAPDFKLQYFDGRDLKDVSLSEYRGKKMVVLAFYIFAFTGGCARQMMNFQHSLNAIEDTNTQLLGISMDSPFVNRAFADQIGATFPLLSDRGGEVTHRYGVFVDGYKAARRVNFLIGKDGRILEEQLDRDAIDPTKIVTACQRPPILPDMSSAKQQIHDPCALGATGVMAALGAAMQGAPPTSALPPGCGAGNADVTAPVSGSSAAQPDTGTAVTVSAQPTADAPNVANSSSRFVNGVPQCARTQNESGNLWIVNSCNIAVTVRFTNDNGPFWGLADVGPNNRSMISTMGLYDPRKNGNVYVFACPKGSSAVMPNGNEFLGTNYKGQFTCLLR